MKLETFKKGEFNPKINVLPLTKDRFDPSTVPHFSVSISNNNKNVHRAVLTNNQVLFKALLKSNQKISSLFGYWSPECEITPLQLALESNNEYFIREIFKETTENKLKKGYIPEIGLKSISTGYVSKQAYGVRVRKVQMSRGGREGNNAFICTESTQESLSCIEFDKVIPKCTAHTINLLCTLFPGFTNQLGGYIGHAVRSGNLEISRHLLQICIKSGGFGFNSLHEEVLEIRCTRELLFCGHDGHEIPSGSATPRTRLRGIPPSQEAMCLHQH